MGPGTTEILDVVELLVMPTCRPSRLPLIVYTPALEQTKLPGWYRVTGSKPWIVAATLTVRPLLATDVSRTTATGLPLTYAMFPKESLQRRIE
eukprot:3625849-Rhodomonas_salina.1